MAPEKVIEMAKQAGFRVGYIEINDGSKYPFIAPITSTDVRHELQAFAQLVRNSTLEEAAVKCEEIDFSYSACEQFVSGEAAFECGKQIRSMKK